MGMYTVNGLNQVDGSLTQADKAADAKATGEITVGEKLASTFGQIVNARVIYEDYNKVIESNNVGYPAAQSMCAIDNNHIAIGYIGYTDVSGSVKAMDNGKIKVVNLDDGTFREAVLPIGHANSLTYNPDRNVIYCAPSEYPSGATNNTLVIDYDTLTIIDTLSLRASGIAYDRKNHQIVMRAENTVWIYDQDFNLLRTLTLQGSVGGNQGIECVDGYLIQPKGFGGKVETRIKGTIGDLIQINSLTDGSLYRMINIPTMIDNTRANESEEICVFPNGSAAVLYINPAILNTRVATVFGIGIPLAELTLRNEIRRQYFVDSTATGLGIGTEAHPFKSLRQLALRDISDTRVSIVSLDETAKYHVVDARKATIIFKAGCIVNAPELEFENCDIVLFADTGYDTPYPSLITTRGVGNISIGIPIAGNIYNYQAVVRIARNVGGQLYLTEGAIVRAMTALSIGTLRIRHGAVMFLGDATYNNLIVADNGTLIESGILTEPEEPETGTAPPSEGTYARGNIVWNSEPTAGGTLCWVCVVAGTPGTWAAVPISS